MNSMSWQAPRPITAIFWSVMVLGLYMLYIASGTGQFLYEMSKEWAPYSLRQHLGMSKRFLLQYGHVAFLFSLLVLSRYIFVSQTKLTIYGTGLRWVNQYSTSVFLFHFPILAFVVAVTEYDRTNLIHQALLFFGTLAFSVALGRMCFKFKPWFDLRQSRVLQKLENHFPRPDSTKNSTTPLSLRTSHSEYLTLVKLFATVCVVLGHFSFEQFTNLTIPGFNGSAPRFAVPTFFMISGYFLMMSIDRTQAGAASMIGRRAFSLYYIVVPMLLVTLFLDGIGYRIDPTAYEYSDYYVSEKRIRPYPNGEALAIFFSSLLYLNELWIFNLLDVRSEMGGMRAYSNDVFWFMCYLIPYSALLISARLLPAGYNLLAVILLCLVIGPPILLLAPLFFSGSLAYVIHKKWNLPIENIV